MQNQDQADDNMLQVDVDHHHMAVVQDGIYLQVPIRDLHVFDSRGHARC